MGIGRPGGWPARMVGLAPLGLLLFAAGCSQAPARSAPPRSARTAPATRAKYQAAANRALGDGSQVILSGDLAHDGHIQLLIVNRLSKTPGNTRDGILISRAAILEKDSENWREIFLADDHLKNEEGYLQGAPLGSVSVWRLRSIPQKDGLTMFFTPLRQASGADPATVEVRWNPLLRRYQTFDRQNGRFLDEAPRLGGMPLYRMKQ